MIKLFVSDIDGCLAEPYRPFDRERFQKLAAYVEAGDALDEKGPLPAFSICSGRAYPYVEAMTQALGLKVPVLFEAGGGMFDPVAVRVIWNPSFTPEVEKQIQTVRHWLIRECLPGTSFMYDYGKRTQAGIIGPDADDVEAYAPIVEAYVDRHFPDLCVFHTPVSIEVLAAGVTKRQGLAWLADHLGCSMGNVAFIGDTNGDLGALQAVGHAFAPANATDAVKAQAHLVTEGAVIEGVLEAYRWCRAYNEEYRGQAAPSPRQPLDSVP